MSYPPTITPRLLRIAARSPAPPGVWPAVHSTRQASLLLAHGRQGIAGTVRIDTTPVARIVRLYERSSGRLVREMTSAPDGSYGWLNLRDRWRYYVVAVDIQPGGVNAAIADYVHPT